MANWEIVIEGRQGTNDMLTVLHYASSGVEPPSWADAATVIRGHLADHMAPICAARVTWVGITVREDIPGGVGVFFPFAAGTLVGLNSESDQADILTMLVRKVTGSLVKPTQGWVLQGGVTAHALTGNGTWEPTIMDEVEAYLEDIRVLNIAGPSTLTMQIKARNPTAPNTQAYTTVSAVAAANTPRGLKTRFPASGS